METAEQCSEIPVSEILEPFQTQKATGTGWIDIVTV